MPRNDRRRRRERPRSLSKDYLRWIGVGLLALKFALVPLVFDPTSLTAFALPKAIVSESLAAGLLVVLVLMAVRDGARSWIRNAVVPAVCAVLLAYVIATAFALDRYLAVFGSHDRLLGLLAMVDMAVTTIALIQVPRPEHLRVLIGAALVGGVLISAYGLLQVLGLDPVPWSQRSLRVFSTLGNPTPLGHYLAVLAAGSLALSALRVVTTRDRVMLVGLALTFLVVALASGTRAVALAVPVFLVIGWLLVRRALAPGVVTGVGFARARRAIVVGGLGTAAVIVLVVATQLLGERLVALASDPTSLGDDRSVAGRIAIYEIALDAFRDHPLTGVGPDNFEVAFPTYRPERFFSVTRVIVPDTSAHSWLASLVSDAGALGLVAFIALLAVLVVATLQRPSQSHLVGWSLILSYLAVGLLTVDHIGTLWLFWAGVAVVGQGAAEVPRTSRRLPGAALAIPVLAVLAWAVASAPAWTASRSAQTSNGYTGIARYDAAVVAGRDAVAKDGARAIYWDYLGTAYTRQGKFSNARDAFLQAWKRAPHNIVYLSHAVRAEVGLAQSGDNSSLAAALVQGVTAVATDANNPDAHWTLALAFAANSRFEDAARTSERARQLDPQPLDIADYEIAARVYLRISRPADAERWARDGLGITGVSGKDAVPIRLALAQALVDLGRNAEATAQLSLVIAVDPTNAEAARIVAEINAPKR